MATAVGTTGRYAWTLTVTMNYGTPIVKTVSGTAFVVAEDANPLGAGWTLGSVNQLVDIATGGGNPAGKLLVYGSGGSAFFTDTGTSTYTSPVDDTGTLTRASGGGLTTYTYAAVTGETWTLPTGRFPAVCSVRSARPAAASAP